MKKIQILGTGCPKCKKLAENTQTAINDFPGQFEITKVTEINEIISFGIMQTPGLALDGKVLSAGKLLKPEEIVELLKKNGA
ncbi:TM0996/MTH895 family glutaredoxin-like protein [Myxococcota bacterium]|nr:TM0996/MTH895 family glutaredoxin-like protein [Myxococcota bacterium]MBU1383186.1 TM0996/MTH895 family glutaredoxin-like protein [Myxococcota bacterium]MBU1497178.1 TM0996/MTH895 family glutaredoxin-like protein [Myxococcota bacterium]